MNNILQHFLSLFSSEVLKEEDILENISEVLISVNISLIYTPTTDQLNSVLFLLNDRDSLHISIKQEETVIENFNCSDSNIVNFDTYMETIRSNISGDDVNLIFTITKRTKNNYISIYYPEIFLKWINIQPIRYKLSALKMTFVYDQAIVFEFQDENKFDYQTRSIKFISKGIAITQPNDILDLRLERASQIKNISYSNLSYEFFFIPDDFYPISRSNSCPPSMKLFLDQFCLLHSIIYLFDTVIIKEDNNDIDYKLNGYKSINGNVNIDDIDLNSSTLYYDIYKWSYEGGNLIDKIGIARNIISLNFDKSNLKLDNFTLNAIQSSFTIYQKENIQQYIEVRNQISSQLVELQDKVDKIVDSYVDNYKKSSLAIVSLFISIIIMQVISDGNILNGFTSNILILSFSFLIISTIVLFFSVKEVNKQIVRYKKIYDNMKDRYTDLLHRLDIDRILNNDKDFIENINYLNEKKRNYTILWISTIITLALTFCIIAIINNAQYIRQLVEYIEEKQLIGLWMYSSLSFTYVLIITLIVVLHKINK